MEDDAVPEIVAVETTEKSFANDQSATDKVDATQLPGYDIGFNYGKIAGMASGIEGTLEAFRICQLESGTDPGVSFWLAQSLKRWMHANEERLKAAGFLV